MRFHVLDEPCMLLHKFLLREEGLAIKLALYHPPLRGAWNGLGWICTLTQEIEICRSITTLIQGVGSSERAVIDVRKITTKIFLTPTKSVNSEAGRRRDAPNITPDTPALGSY
jgi:hypothetical protein